MTISLSSNFIKGGMVAVSDEKTVTINSNSFVQKRLDELFAKKVRTETPETIEGGFSEGLDPLMVEELISDHDSDDPSSTSVIKNPNNAVSLEEADRITTQAQAKADELLAEAEGQAEQIREESRQQGYEDGLARGREEAKGEIGQRVEEQRSRIEEEYKKKAKDLEKEYQIKLNEMEPLLVEKLCGIFSAITGARLSEETETVMYLLNRALTLSDSTRRYIIHVSAEDYDEVRGKKEDVAKGTGIMPENIDVVEDMTLGAGGCLIESDGGIWDCSLGTQLKLLTQQLKILSYEPE